MPRFTILTSWGNLSTPCAFFVFKERSWMMVHGRNNIPTLQVSLVSFPWRSESENREEAVSKWLHDLSSFLAVYQKMVWGPPSLEWLEKLVKMQIPASHPGTTESEFLMWGLGICILKVAVPHLRLLYGPASENCLYSGNISKPRVRRLLLESQLSHGLCVLSNPRVTQSL